MCAKIILCVTITDDVVSYEVRSTAMIVDTMIKVVATIDMVIK